MTREEFDALVRRVEKQFAGHPAALRWRVVMLAIVGYTGLLVWLGIILLLSAGFYALIYWVDSGTKIACAILGTIVLFGGGYAALRALLVRLSEPEGRPVTRVETPELFRMLDKLQAELHSPAFHQVLITPVCNAGVTQVPRLGVLGWQRNYLLLGLLLLDGLSPDEVRAVLAHEFTHLSHEHGRLSHWLYRLRRSWEEIFKQLSAPRVRGQFSMRPFVVKFVEAFWPRFNAHAFVLSRANEYEADSQSSKLAGTTNAASALVRLDVLTRQLDDKLWPDLLRLANEQSQPPEDVFRRLRDGIRAGPPAEDAARWRSEALQVTSTNLDTHPCLTERLRALQVPPTEVVLGPLAQSAAEALLGPANEAIRRDVQKLWSNDVAQKWRERHARASALKDRLNSIEQTSAAVDVDRLWDKAVALLDLEGGRTAMPLLREVLALRPDHAPARFHLGRLLLEDNSDEGVGCLERAIELDEQCFPQACALLHDFYRSRGQTAQLRELDARMDHHEQSLAASHLERRQVTASDTFIAHGLTESELQALCQQLEPEPRIVRAHLARKELKYFPTQRLFVLCVYPPRAWHGFANHDLDRALVNRLSQKLRVPGRLMVFSPSGSFRALSKKVARVPGADIFFRSS